MDPVAQVQSNTFIFAIEQEEPLIASEQNIRFVRPFHLTSSHLQLQTEIRSQVRDIILQRFAPIEQNIKVGWFDGPFMRQMLADVHDGIALIDLDIFTSLDEVHICTAYLDIYNHMPVETPRTDIPCTVVYETYRTWKEDISNCTKTQELPELALHFVHGLEDAIGKRFSYVFAGDPDVSAML